MMESYSGPYPHPDHLARFNEVVPGSGRDIFDEFKAQGEHRRNMEALLVRGNERRADRGQWMAFLIVIFFLGTSVWLIREGHETAGIILGSVDLTALVTVFIVGRLPKRKKDSE